jgi:hypothetical protein
MPAVERDLQRRRATPESTDATTSEVADSAMQFSARGALPGVATGSHAAPTASERGYGASSTPVVQFRKKDLPKGEEGFKQMWDAHPHNNYDEEDEDISSPELLDEHGLPQSFANTCAIRISIMLNGIGETITPSKTAAAGMKRRPHYSKKTKQYYILGAKEMWEYITKAFRKPDVVFPPAGRFQNSDKYDEAFETSIKPALAGKRGFVAFDKIFSFGGTGHVDLFDGEKLSAAGGWYQSQRILLWYI